MLLHATTAWLRARARQWRAGAWSCCAHTHGENMSARQVQKPEAHGAAVPITA